MSKKPTLTLDDCKFFDEAEEVTTIKSLEEVRQFIKEKCLNAKGFIRLNLKVLIPMCMNYIDSIEYYSEKFKTETLHHKLMFIFYGAKLCCICDNEYYAVDNKRTTCSEKCRYVLAVNTKDERHPDHRNTLPNYAMKTFGVKSYAMTQECKDKTLKSNIEKYGVSTTLLTKDVILKSKQTKLEKYGDENYLNRDKIEATCLERYGVKNCSQNTEIHDRQQKSMYRLKDYIMPSGAIVQVQGYENNTLDELLKLYNENDIIIQTSKIPKIKYILNNKQKLYFPDFYIPKDNLIIEVKSDYTAQCEIDSGKLQQKQKSTLSNGFKYKLIIFTQKRNRDVEFLSQYLTIHNEYTSIDCYHILHKFKTVTRLS